MSWDTKLPQPIALKRGPERFLTRRDAATFLQKRYARARSGALTAAVADLMAASEDPSPDKITRAADQLSTFLAQENLIDAVERSGAGTGLEGRIRAMLTGRPLTPAAKAVRKVSRAARARKPSQP